MKTKSRPYDLFVLFVVLVVLPVLFAGGFCLEALRRLHHLRTALHNGMAQIRLLLLQSTQCKKQKIQRRGQLWVQDASAQARWEKALTPIKKAPRILVLDPNMMRIMRYAPKAPVDVIDEDMRSLLNVSTLN